MTAPVIAVERSGNRKIGDASATYVAQASCPTACPFLGAGCYAEGGRMALHTRDLNKASSDLAPEDLATLEAAAIQSLTGRRDLRLHVVGDARTRGAVAILADAVSRYLDRGRKHKPRAWTYTHAWRDVPRRVWRRVSVLASCESLADVGRAWRKGYAAALVVAEHPADGKAWSSPEGFKVIPCPEQTRGLTCTDCRLCLDDTALHKRRAVIAFAAHGNRRRMVEGKLA